MHRNTDDSYWFNVHRNKIKLQKNKKSLIEMDINQIRTRNKQKHFIMMKEEINQENITIVCMYVTNNRALKYRRQI